MPGRDQTGPLGMGPVSGKGMGYCGGNRGPAFHNSRFGRRPGRGPNFGFQNQNRGYGGGIQPIESSPAYNPELESGRLEEEAKFLEQNLKTVQERIEALKKYQGKENQRGDNENAD